MRANSVSRPTRWARITIAPDWLRVPANRRSPGCLITGCDSPVNIASSTVVLPNTTTPSTGNRSPGNTNRAWPTCTVPTGIDSVGSASPNSVGSWVNRRARAGFRASKAVKDSRDRTRTRASIVRPNSTNPNSMAGSSKKQAQSQLG